MSVSIPLAGGVPGISGPPNWLSAPPAGSYDLDDVRWRGAAKTAFGAGGAGSNSLRAIQAVDAGQQYIYLSFRAAFVQSLSDQNDVVYVGLRRTGGTKAMVIRLQVHGPGFTPAGPPSANPPANVQSVQISTRLDTDAQWTVQAMSPSWIAANARAWLQSSADVAADPNNRWAIQLRIPAATAGDIAATTGPNIGTDFEMWYVIQGSLSNGSPAILADYRTSGNTSAGSLALGNYPNPFPAALWDQFLLTSGPAAFGGVAIYGSGTTDVRVRNVAHGEGTTIDNGASNTFIARPRNYRPAGSTIPAGNVNATFRIANWGSVGGDPHQVNFASGVWDFVPGNSATIPVLSSVDIPAIAAAANPPNNEPIALTATMNLAANKSIHQCILVTLSGTNLQFLNDSTYQNMNYDTASLLEREAEISVVGLPTFSPQPRDVYLAVEKINMAAKTPGGTNTGRFLQGSMTELMGQGGALADKLRSAQRRLSGQDQSSPKQRLDALVNILTDAGVSQEEFDQLFPTFRVHAYHDTGERVTGADGQPRPVVRAQSSFGIYAYHEGPLEGWQTSLQGAQRIDDNLYVLRVPNNGTAKVKVRIQGVTPGEERIPDDPIRPRPGASQPGCLLGIWYAIRKLLGL